MNVSIIAVTARMGCFDLLVHCMEQQTFSKDDFEVIVVDSYYNERKDFVKDRLPKNFRHIGLPEDRPFYDACYANNVGTREAQGELLIYFSDCNWAYPDFVKDHWDIYETVPGYSMTGYVDRFPIPPLKHGITRSWELDAWSIFEKEFTADYARWYFEAIQSTYRERKGQPETNDGGIIELPGDKWYGSLNESIPMQVVKDCNGWNEAYDGCYGLSDIDLGVRANLAGWKFLIKADSINKKLGQKSESGVIPASHKPQTRTLDDNWRLFDEMKASGKWRTPDGHGLV